MYFVGCCALGRSVQRSHVEVLPLPEMIRSETIPAWLFRFIHAGTNSVKYLPRSVSMTT